MATFPLNFWYRGVPIGDARAGASTDFGYAYRGDVGQVVGKSLATLVSVASTDVFAAMDRGSLSASLQSLDPFAASERSSLAASAQDRDSASLADLASSLASVASTDSITARDAATVSVLILSADAFAASDVGLWTIAGTTTSIVSADAFAFTDGLQPRLSGGGAASITVDTFTDVAGTALAGHTPDAGGSWTNHPSYASQGTGKITAAGRARFGAVGSGSSAALYWSGAPTSADYAVSADVYVASSGGQAGVLARVDVASNTMIFAYYTASSGVLTLGQIVSGVTTSLATTTLSWSVGSTNALSLAVSGSSATASVGGSVVLGPASVTPAAAGRIGVYLTDNPATASDSTSTHLDNFGFNGSLSIPTQSGVSPEFITLLAGEGFAVFESLGTLLAASRSTDLASAWDSSSLAASVASRESWAFLDAGFVLLSGPLLVVSSDGFGFAELHSLGASLAGVDPAGLADGSIVSASLASSDLAAFAQLSAPLLYLITARDPFGFLDRSGGLSASIADSEPIHAFDGFGVSVAVGAFDSFTGGDRGISSLIMADVPITGLDRIAFIDRAAITVRVSGLDPIAFFDLATLGVSIGSADALAFVETGLRYLAPLGVFSMDSARFGEAIDLEASIGVVDPWSFLDSTAIGVGVASMDAFSVTESAYLALSVSSCDAFGWHDAGAVSVFTATLNYHIYANDGAGGQINYTSAVASTGGLSWTSGPLAAGGDYWWGVRTYSLATGLEEQNLDAAVEVVLDAAWVDVTRRPAPPTSLRASALAGGVVRVEWSDRRPAGVSRATGYRVYQGVGSVDWTTVAADVPATAGIAGSYSTQLGPLTDGVAYLFGVRAYNATASETNTTSVSATADATGPAAVDGFAVTLTSES